MSELPHDAGPVLLRLARSAIAAGLRVTSWADDVPLKEDWLRSPGATFVTLTLGGDLRGCIGSLVAHQALGEDVRSNAVSAAFRDPRFPPLSVDEFKQVDIEVSVLSDPEPMTFSGKENALANLRPGVDGVILSARGHRATFLPQVWEELPDPSQFIAHLMRKAGLPADYWAPDIRIDRYQVTAFHEQVDD
ncbi:MAG: AmmeMemoRadiSam system protein A [Propionibacteriaceae bacterium]|nr:AmmeMemoRadiSam system protein A [Propionibacteriaceae bacterium]